MFPFFYATYLINKRIFGIFINMYRKIDKTLTNDVINSYQTDLMGSDAIAIKYKMSKKTVLSILKSNKIQLRKRGQQYKGGKSESDKRYYSKNKEKRLKYYSDWGKENRDYLRDYHTKWREKNKDHLRETRNKYERNRKHSDPKYKLIANFRTAIYTTLKENNVNKYGHYFEILGYTPEELMNHLEPLFTEGMSWDNYGKWHIDHIIPISSFNFSSIYDEEFKKCWSLPNLQPMWGEENIRKSNKIL